MIDGNDTSPYVPVFGAPVATLGAVPLGGAVTVDVTAAFQGGPGLYSLAIANHDTNGSTFSSRQHATPTQRPRLRLRLAAGD